ncbi:hypothetical protein ACIBQ0_28865 [Nocardia nova]|uniref:hypothetical protein n=1 Tax=Nocardia nova TaxID=37330 RepID=UPI0037B26A6F
MTAQQTTTPPRRPENIELTERQRDRVLAYLDRRRAHCPACGATDFRVGDALYLGFLFLDEELDSYMVALTCANPACPVPHTGIRMRRAQLWLEPVA